jgi:galactonate dehydratase
VRNKIKAYANGWYTNRNDLVELAERANDVMSRGYQAMKFAPFGPGGRESTPSELRQSCKAVEALRKTVGEDVEILLEFHGRFSPSMALEAIRAMVPYHPTWCEEPIPAHNDEAMAQIVAVSPLRVATGEHTYSRYGFLSLLRQNAAHIIQPDIVYSGGFLETKKIASMAEAHYVSVAPHNCDGPLNLWRQIPEIHPKYSRARRGRYFCKPGPCQAREGAGKRAAKGDAASLCAGEIAGSRQGIGS